MTYQTYLIHLENNMVITVHEPYDLPFEKGLIAKYRSLTDGDILEVGDAIEGFAYIPKRNIFFICTGDVMEV